MSKTVFFIITFSGIWQSAQIQAKDIYGIEVSALYQLEDEVNPPFDFQSKRKLHKCGGKGSNHFRIYSEDPTTADRRFRLTLTAFSQGLKLSVGTVKCEGKRMVADWVRLSH